MIHGFEPLIGIGLGTKCIFENVISSYNSKDYKKLAEYSNLRLKGLKLKEIYLYSKFKTKNYHEVLVSLKNNNVQLEASTTNDLYHYINKIDGNKAISILFKIEEGILYMLKKDKRRQIESSLEKTTENIISEMRKLKGLKFNELYQNEIEEISLKNLNRIKAKDLALDYGLIDKKVVYQVNSYIREKSYEIKNSELLEKLNKKSYRDLNKEEMISIYKQNKKYRVSAKDITSQYNLTNKKVVYKINRVMKNTFDSLDSFLQDEVPNNVINLFEKQIA